MPKPPAESVEYSHHYLKVPRLGTVIFSPEAMSSLKDAGVIEEDLEQVLRLGEDAPAYRSTVYSGSRTYNGIRLLLKTRPHLKGAAAVCIDGYRVKS